MRICYFPSINRNMGVSMGLNKNIYLYILKQEHRASGVECESEIRPLSLFLVFCMFPFIYSFLLFPKQFGTTVYGFDMSCITMEIKS